MRRRVLLSLALLPAGLPSPVAAQDGLARAAGRQAIALATAQRWAEAEAVAIGAAPPIRRMVTWMRLQSRDSGAGAAENAGFALGNSEWPGQATLGRRVEEALLLEPDDTLAVLWFAA